MKLDQATIEWIESALNLVEYGEVIIVVHAGEIKGVDTKGRKRHTKKVDRVLHKKS